MNNVYTYNSGKDNCLPQGLSTAHIRPPGVNGRDKSLMNNSEEGNAYICSAVGGSVSSVFCEDHETRGQDNSCTDNSWGIRGKVKGFSSKSRRNLLRRIASINRGAFRSLKGRLISVTLTYPHIYPEDPEVCKRHRKALCKRLERKYGVFAAFWRMGIQKRGAFHFHLLLFIPRSFGRIDTIRHFISSSWYEICGEVSEVHLRVGTRVEQVRKWRKATSYAERYLAKEEEFPEGLETGRIWGIWNEKLLPIEWETVKVSLRDAYKIRRVYRKLAKRRGSGDLRRLTVFAHYENVVRLLQFLGYRLE